MNRSLFHCTSCALALVTMGPGDSVAEETPETETSVTEAAPSQSGLQFVRVGPGVYERGMPGRDVEHAFHLAHLHSYKPEFRREQPSHLVRITKPFEIATTEVTVGQFRQFVEATGYRTDAEKNGGAYGIDFEAENWVDRYRQDPAVTWRSPGFEQSDADPVVAVSWRDARAFCDWLSGKEGRTYRLPSEAEWEYAARGGSDNWYFWGRSPDEARLHANAADGSLEAMKEGMLSYQRALGVEADEGDGHPFTAPVGSFEPNPWGLHDTAGNVWEWCEDRWDGERYKVLLDDVPRPERNTHTVPDPLFLEKTEQHQYGDWRVIRGGAWNCGPANLRCSIRTFQEAADAAVYTGFRVAREPAEPDG